MLDADGKPLQSVGVPLDPNGKGWDFKDLSIPRRRSRVQLDAPRTWRFVQALLEAAHEAPCSASSSSSTCARMLLAQADKVKAPKALRERFADITCQPDTPHDDHMHVRFFCTPEDIANGCFDKPPMYPWHTRPCSRSGSHRCSRRGADRKRARERSKQRTTTPEQARKRAGPMHSKVRRSSRSASSG